MWIFPGTVGVSTMRRALEYLVADSVHVTPLSRLNRSRYIRPLTTDPPRTSNCALTLLSMVLICGVSSGPEERLVLTTS